HRGMSWNPHQQALLEAMGYTLYRQAPAAPAPAAVSPSAPAAPAWGAVASGDPLWRALCRAAGGRDLAGLGLPPLSELRADPAAKRALWPRLRSLRRN